MFYPSYFTNKVTDITYEFLKYEKVKGIVLDIDDTLTSHGNPNIKNEILDWIKNLKSKNIKIILLSNNFRKRVKPFASKIGLPYICFAIKPLTIGIKEAQKKLSCQKNEILVVGDQLFSDILMANLYKVKSILVEPISQNPNLKFLSFKRSLEKGIRKAIYENENLNLRNIKYSERYNL